ncbi:MAG: DNA polymerase III subunit gamma/tau [Acidimicrobiales bacterium]
MAFQSLYRRYRSQRFGELRGQDHIAGTLRKAVAEEKVAHAYLFSGPRGTGKTSTARILAKALNCPDVADGEPCGVCESCTAITEGRSLDVFELDAASHNGVEAMRDLVGRAAVGSPGKWKVYIVDEAHMLSAAASNTLLKTLEEPPAHVIFVLATTEPQKVLPTITSRTQHFEFRLLPADVLVEHLRWVVADAGLDVASEVIDLVARRGRGSARDALSALDQVAAAGGFHDDAPSFDELVEALCERDLDRALAALAERCATGRQPRQLATELLERLRQAFLSTVAPSLVGLPDEDAARVESQARRLGRAATVRAMELLGQTLVDMREAPEPRVLLEVALVRLCRPETDPSPAALLERIERLERATATHGPPVAPVLDRPATVAAPEAKPSTKEASPLDGPRRTLGAFRTAAAAAAASAPSAPPPTPPAPTPSPDPTPPAAPPTTTPATTPATSPAPTGEAPGRDELTLAWADAVLEKLSQRARARFRVGRFVDLGAGAIGFALPNAIHRDRCQELLGEVHGVLAAHFGRPVTLRLVLDAEVGSAATAEAEVAAEAEEEDIDVSELQPAPASEVTSPVDQLLQAFEGATVVEE